MDNASIMYVSQCSPFPEHISRCLQDTCVQRMGAVALWLEHRTFNLENTGSKSLVSVLKL